MAQDSDLPKEMGLRHRSGLGMSEENDSKVVIISEEQEDFLLAYRGEIAE